MRGETGISSELVVSSDKFLSQVVPLENFVVCFSAVQFSAFENNLRDFERC